MREPQTSARSIIKSFRLDVSLGRELNGASTRRGVTESAYVSEALRGRLLMERLSSGFEGITVGRDIFRSIVALAEKEAIEILGAEVANRDIPFGLDLLDLPHNAHSLSVFLREVTAKSWQWFKIGFNNEDDGPQLVVHHGFGMNWSIFLMSYLAEAFELVSQNRPGVVATERLVRVERVSGQGTRPAGADESGRRRESSMDIS